MDFFASQEAARRKTKWLVLLLCIAVTAIIAVVYLVVAAMYAQGVASYAASDSARVAVAPPAVWYWQPEVLAGVAVAVLLIVGLGSLYKMAALRGGGEAVARMMGGRLVPPNTTVFEERRLLNVVEEMAIAAGMAVPPVYLLEKELGINAFAAGYHPDDAVIGITRGCMTKLKRDELQGVIAHEFSHVLNGDMRLNVRLMGVVFGILVLGMVGYYALRFGGRVSTRRNGVQVAIPVFVVGLVVMAVGYIGVFFGKIIKAMVSQSREYLADASAVQFTRNPIGLTDALRRIGGAAAGSRLRNPHAEECSHMYFANGLRTSFLRALATHPPLLARIRAVSPHWDGSWLEPEPPRLDAEGEAQAQTKEQAKGAGAVPPDLLPGMPRIPGLEGAAGAILPAVLLSVDEAMADIGTVKPRHLEQARETLALLPPVLRDHAREGFGARAVIYALLLDRGETVRDAQWQRLRERADPQVFALTGKLQDEVRALPEGLRLPLLDLTLPALQSLSPPQYEAFLDNLRDLIVADEEMDFFEFCLSRIVTRRLDRHFRKAPPRPVRIYGVQGALREVAVVLSLLARLGHDAETKAREAYARAMATLDLRGAEPPALLPVDQCGLAAADDALTTLLETSYPVRKQVLGACAVCIGFDGEITPREAELFRAFGESLECPVPPLGWPTPAGQQPGAGAAE
jgi:Zn-dependent protease with chaperone function